MRTWPLLVSVLLAAPAIAAPPPPPVPEFRNCKVLNADATRAAQARRAGERNLRSMLTDPEGARMHETTFRRVNCGDATHDLVCGAVNAKNQFGGYSGERMWLLVATNDDQWNIWIEGATGLDNMAFLSAMKVCLTPP